MGTLSLVRVDAKDAPPAESFADHTIYQTTSWMNFISRTQNARPLIALVKSGDRIVGRFNGLIFRKYGQRILGSPFRGWTTSYMGFNLEPSVSRLEACLSLENFVFCDLKCVHFEVMDRRLSLTEAKELRYNYRIHSGFEIDLRKSEEKLFASMKSSCRRCIRKAEKEGVRLEIAENMSFVDEYYAQMKDVFAKQKRVPTYPKKRVQALLEHLLPTGQLLLVRALNKDSTCIATGIFPAMNDTMYFWGGASWRPYQILRPNEAVQWFAIRYWKTRGISRYDMGGAGEYKRKYGGTEIAVPWVRKSKYAILEKLRSRAKKTVDIKRRILGLGKK